MMNRSLLLISTLLMAPAMGLAEEAGEWMGPEQPAPRLSLSYGQDEDDYQVGSVNANLPLQDGSRAHFTFERGRLADDTATGYLSAGLSSDPLADSVVRIDGIVRGTRDVSRFYELKLEGTRYFERWDFGFQGRGGVVRIEDHGLASDNGGSDSDHRGLRGGIGPRLGYQNGPLYLSLSATEYFYRWEDGDPESDGSPLFANAPGPLGRTGSGAGASQGAQRSPILTEREGTAMATLFAGPMDWQLGFQRTVATDSEKQDWILLGTSFNSRAGHWIGLNVDVPTEDEDPVFGQITLGIAL